MRKDLGDYANDVALEVIRTGPAWICASSTPHIPDLPSSRFRNWWEVHAYVRSQYIPHKNHSLCDLGVVVYLDNHCRINPSGYYAKNLIDCLCSELASRGLLDALSAQTARNTTSGKAAQETKP